VSESQPQPILSFEHSPSIAALAAALAKAQLVTKSAPKDHTAEVTMKSGGKYTYAYADLAGVWEAGREPLGANGLSLIQSPSLSASGCLEMTTMLLHGSGEWVIGRLTNFPVPDKTPQGVGTAITYARRYTMGAMVGVVSEEDDDGGNAGKPKAKRESREMPATGGARPGAKRRRPDALPEVRQGQRRRHPRRRAGRPGVPHRRRPEVAGRPHRRRSGTRRSPPSSGALEAELARQRGATKAIVNGPPDPAGPPPPKAPSPAYHDAVAAGKANGWLEDNVKHWLKVKRGKSAASEVTADDAAELRKALEPPPKEEDPPF
jgi:hypothetical protein